jgi:hypothetical protein
MEKAGEVRALPPGVFMFHVRNESTPVRNFQKVQIHQLN